MLLLFIVDVVSSHVALTSLAEPGVEETALSLRAWLSFLLLRGWSNSKLRVFVVDHVLLPPPLFPLSLYLMHLTSRLTLSPVCVIALHSITQHCILVH